MSSIFSKIAEVLLQRLWNREVKKVETVILRSDLNCYYLSRQSAGPSAAGLGPVRNGSPAESDVSVATTVAVNQPPGGFFGNFANWMMRGDLS